MKRASLALLVCVVLSVATGSAATKKSEPRRNRLADWSELSLQSGGLQSTWNNASGAVGNLTLSQGGDPGGVLILPPSTPDNWNGGASNWNNGGDWSAGVPGANSDVIIYSGGNDLVTLNVGSTTVSSLTLGGASNGTTSELTDGGLKQTLTITNALNVGQTGLLNLTGGSSVTAGADSSNAGTIYLDKGSALSDGGKFSNTGTISLFSGSSLSIAGDATNSNSMSTGGGAISISGSLTNKPGSDFFLYNSGDVAKVGTLNNGGYTYVGPGAALNLTNQMGGITNAVSGSQFQLWGSFNDVLGSANGFANLNSVEGSVSLYGQNITDTPGSGTLTISNGALTADYNPHSNLGTTLTINGNVNNSGFLATGYYSGGVSTLAINGTLTNNGQVYLYAGGDVANVGTLVNNGLLYIGTDATLNLSTQLNVTDIFSTYEIYGTFNAGPNNAFASLNSIEGTLYLANGQTTNITPGSGTLTNSGNFAIGNGTTVGITGDVVNNRYLTTDVYVGGSNDKLSISGTLTNNNQFYVGGSGDVANVGTLNNRGSTGVGPGATLNLTNQLGGVTDAVAGSSFALYGTFNDVLGGANGFANLSSVEGIVNLYGQNITNTPGGGTVTIASGGNLTANYDPYTATVTNLTINGNVNNSGFVATGHDYHGGTGNMLSITGALTNNLGGTLALDGSGDVASVGTLSNGGAVYVATGATLNLTNQPNGITDVVAGSSFDIAGTFTSGGSTSGFANLTGVEGTLILENGMTTSITPGNGTLTIAGTGIFDTSNGSDTEINGGVDNSGTVSTGGSGGNTMTVTGLLTNEATGQINLNGPGDVLQALAGLSNSGLINVNNGSSIDPPFFNNLGTLNIDGTSRFVVGTPTPMGGQGYIQLHNGTLGEMIASMNSFGVINVNGSALLDGTLAILLQGGFNPSVGSTYKFLNFTPGMLSGIFANIENDIFNNGTEKWFVDYENGGGYVELIAEPNGGPVSEPATLLVLIPGLLGAGYGLRRKLLM